MSGSPVTIVLVHGACHGAWCWEDVVGPLEERGWNVDAVELPLTTLTEDADVVRDAVRRAKETSRVLLAAHSYGGTVISEGGHEADALVFLAGSLPGPGESAGDMFPAQQTPWLDGVVHVSEDGLAISIDPVDGAAAFFNGVPEDKAAAALARLRPMQMAVFGPAVERPAWMDLPSSYVICSEDRAVAPSYQYERAARLPEHVVFDTGHALFFSATDELVARLHELAARVAQHRRVTRAHPAEAT
jgi:pimeloyl-ACP methyl ester carboxylesterase